MYKGGMREWRVDNSHCSAKILKPSNVGAEEHTLGEDWAAISSTSTQKLF